VRIRSTKPEFWRSRRIASVSWDARLVLKGLESYVDDNGVGKDDVALIASDIFSRDLAREASRTLARISEAISELNHAGLLWRYQPDEDELIYIAFWEQIQRIDKPQPGRFPRPDGTFNYKDSLIRESPANIREPSRTLAPVTEEQGNRGTGASLVTTTRKPTSAIAKSNGHTTLNIIHSWTDSQSAVIPTRIVNDATQQVQALVNDGVAPETIAAGLAEWWKGEYPPSTIPNYVARAGQPRPRRATGTDRAADILAIPTDEQPF
jgi:hypothetical protein